MLPWIGWSLCSESTVSISGTDAEVESGIATRSSKKLQALIECRPHEGPMGVSTTLAAALMKIQRGECGSISATFCDSDGEESHVACIDCSFTLLFQLVRLVLAHGKHEHLGMPFPLMVV